MVIFKNGRLRRVTKSPVLTSRKYNRIVKRNAIHPYVGYEEAGMVDLVSVLQLRYYYDMRDSKYMEFGEHLTDLMYLIDALSMPIIQEHPVVNDYGSHLYPKFLVESAIRTANADCPYQYEYSSRQIFVPRRVVFNSGLDWCSDMMLDGYGTKDELSAIATSRKSAIRRKKLWNELRISYDYKQYIEEYEKTL